MIFISPFLRDRGYLFYLIRIKHMIMNDLARNIPWRLSVTEIVLQDYRTAAVFQRYGIDYCCSGKWPLDEACAMATADPAELERDLQLAMRPFKLPSATPFEEWPVPFLIDYIVIIHHDYLKKALPALNTAIHEFAKGHQSKFPFLFQLEKELTFFQEDLYPHLRQEEEIIFPYIRQLNDAFRENESYGRLLVRTLAKPLAGVSLAENTLIEKALRKFRELTNGHNVTDDSCITLFVILSRLRELGDDLRQHVFLESDILFPKALQMEKELLAGP